MTFETGEEMSTYEQIDSALFDTTASFEISISKHFDLSLISVDDLTLTLFSLDTQSDFDEFFHTNIASSLAHGLTHLHRTAQGRSCFRVPFTITTDSSHLDSILLLNVQENYHKAIVHIVDLTQFSEAKFQLEELKTGCWLDNGSNTRT